MEIKKASSRRGRPPGSGSQTRAVERVRQNRIKHAASGGLRLDMTLDAETAHLLRHLMIQWNCKTRKEAVQKAIYLIANAGLNTPN